MLPKRISWESVRLGFMNNPIALTTERVDDIPLLLAQLERMRVQEFLDKHFQHERELERFIFRMVCGDLVKLYPVSRGSSFKLCAGRERETSKNSDCFHKTVFKTLRFQ